MADGPLTLARCAEIRRGPQAAVGLGHGNGAGKGSPTDQPTNYLLTVYYYTQYGVLISRLGAPLGIPCTVGWTAG